MSEEAQVPPEPTSVAAPQGPSLRPWPSLSLSMGIFATVCVLVGKGSQHEPGLLRWLWECPVKVLSGLPCFTCGITRVVLLIGEGQWLDAFILAPLPFLVITGSWVAGGFHLFARLAGRTPPDEWIARWLAIRKVRYLLVLLFFGTWGYALGRSILTGAP